MEAWRGTVVHQAIQTLVVPCLQNRQPVNWDQVISAALALAERQFQFSAQRVMSRRLATENENRRFLSNEVHLILKDLRLFS
jgi:hypothetical protein